MLGALIGAGASILGGVLQSKATKKASQDETARQREAIAAQQAAAAKVQGLQAPGVAAYRQALNALNDRIMGVPAARDAGGGGGPAPGAPDYDAYISQYADVAAEGQRVLSQTPGYIGDLDGDGQETVRDYGVYHHRTFNDRPVPTAAKEGLAGTSPTEESPAGSGVYGNALNPTYEAPTYTPPADFSFSVDSFKDNPAYKFALEQGSGEVMASASATGALQSGAALKALQDRGQKTAYNFYAPERDSAYARYADGRNFGRSTFESDRGFGRGVYENDRNYLTDRYDRTTDDMFRYTGIGQNALNATTNAIIGEGNSTATGLENIGQSQAGDALQQGNIWSGVVGDLAGTLKGVMNQNSLNSYLRTAAAGSYFNLF